MLYLVLRATLTARCDRFAAPRLWTRRPPPPPIGAWAVDIRAPPVDRGGRLCTTAARLWVDRWTGAEEKFRKDGDVRCPYCGGHDDRVVDSRAADAGAAIRRRRECLGCGQRYSTYERVEQHALAVRKRDGSVEPYRRDKVQAGIDKATKNAGLDPDASRRAAARIEGRIRAMGDREIRSEVIGAEVLEALRELDQVAYVRFASVYKGFRSPEDFVRELASLTERSGHGDTQPR